MFTELKMPFYLFKTTKTTALHSVLGDLLIYIQNNHSIHKVRH